MQKTILSVTLLKVDYLSYNDQPKAIDQYYMGVAVLGCLNVALNPSVCARHWQGVEHDMLCHPQPLVNNLFLQYGKYGIDTRT